LVNADFGSVACVLWGMASKTRKGTMAARVCVCKIINAKSAIPEQLR
jgi:hypothetical protein